MVQGIKPVIRGQESEIEKIKKIFRIKD